MKILKLEDKDPVGTRWKETVHVEEGGSAVRMRRVILARWKLDSSNIWLSWTSARQGQWNDENCSILLYLSILVFVVSDANQFLKNTWVNIQFLLPNCEFENNINVIFGVSNYLIYKIQNYSRVYMYYLLINLRVHFLSLFNINLIKVAFFNIKSSKTNLFQN